MEWEWARRKGLKGKSGRAEGTLGSHQEAKSQEDGVGLEEEYPVGNSTKGKSGKAIMEDTKENTCLLPESQLSVSAIGPWQSKVLWNHK